MMIGDNGISQDVPLASTWKSESFCGSKMIALRVTNFGFQRATLMRAKLADAGNCTNLRITVKLQSKLNNDIILPHQTSLRA